MRRIYPFVLATLLTGCVANPPFNERSKWVSAACVDSGQHPTGTADAGFRKTIAKETAKAFSDAINSYVVDRKMGFPATPPPAFERCTVYLQCSIHADGTSVIGKAPLQRPPYRDSGKHPIPNQPLKDLLPRAQRRHIEKMFHTGARKAVRENPSLGEQTAFPHYDYLAIVFH